MIDKRSLRNPPSHPRNDASQSRFPESIHVPNLHIRPQPRPALYPQAMLDSAIASEGCLPPWLSYSPRLRTLPLDAEICVFPASHYHCSRTFNRSLQVQQNNSMAIDMDILSFRPTAPRASSSHNAPCTPCFPCSLELALRTEISFLVLIAIFSIVTGSVVILLLFTVPGSA